MTSSNYSSFLQLQAPHITGHGHPAQVLVEASGFVSLDLQALEAVILVPGR